MRVMRVDVCLWDSCGLRTNEYIRPDLASLSLLIFLLFFLLEINDILLTCQIHVIIYNDALPTNGGGVKLTPFVFQ
jgi:hypothetical protein